MTDTNKDTTAQDSHRAGPIGRILRLAMAVLITVIVTPYYLTTSSQSNLKIAAVIGGLVIFYTLMHLVISKYVPGLNRWLGAILAIVPATLLFLLGGGIGQMAAMTYVGGSLFIDSLIGDGGCEVMAIPGLIFGKRTHLVCIAFSPFDWLEEKLTLRRKIYG
jgi:hypothetical protein